MRPRRRPGTDVTELWKRAQCLRRQGGGTRGKKSEVRRRDLVDILRIWADKVKTKGAEVPDVEQQVPGNTC
jgi:hypothetical protein